ncbi:MAG: hypothetical protein AAB461_03660, partial [Patescibacteria group bacterium]
TCGEFNLCMDALIGNQQQAGQEQKMDACLSLSCSEFEGCSKSLQQSGPQQGQQDETGKKIQERSMACPKQSQGNSKFEAKFKACTDEKMDACLGLSCSEFEACIKSFQQGSPEQGTGDQQQGQSQENPKFNAKMKSCQEEISREKTSACLSKSCGEFDACLKSLQQGGDQGGDKQQQGEGTPDPAVNSKVQACQKEKVNACLAKPCSEFQACLNSLGGGGDQGGEQQGTPDPAVQSKFMTCFPPPPKNQGPPSSFMENPFLGAILRYLLNEN